MEYKKIHSFLASIVILTSIVAINSDSAYTEPGSQTDPLVTKSYVDKQFNDLKSTMKNEVESGVKSNLGNIKDKIDQMEREIKLLKISGDKDNGSVEIISDKFAVLELKRGQKILADESTELILRSGTAIVIASSSGGVSDLTEGRDLIAGEELEKNHHLIVPRTDGRGLEVKSGTIFIMVKGRYRIS